MNIEYTFQGIRISDIINGYLLSKHYIDYTEEEAINKWNEEVGLLTHVLCSVLALVNPIENGVFTNRSKYYGNFNTKENKKQDQ